MDVDKTISDFFFLMSMVIVTCWILQHVYLNHSIYFSERCVDPIAGVSW